MVPSGLNYQTVKHSLSGRALVRLLRTLMLTHALLKRTAQPHRAGLSEGCCSAMLVIVQGQCRSEVRGAAPLSCVDVVCFQIFLTVAEQLSVYVLSSLFSLYPVQTFDLLAPGLARQLALLADLSGVDSGVLFLWTDAVIR